MSHGPHQGTRRVLGDDCDECVSRSKDLNGMSQIDDSKLKELAKLAGEIHAFGTGGSPLSRFGASFADINAVETLRLMARIVYRSGITQEVAE